MQLENNEGEKKREKKRRRLTHSQCVRKACRSFWHLKLEHALGASVELLVAIGLLPGSQVRVRVDLLQNLPQVGSLLSREGNLISTLGSQEQQTINHVGDLDICKRN